MNRYPVNDSNIISVGYDEISKTLEIEFKLQAIHQYFDVSLDEFVALMKATAIETHYFDYVYCRYFFDVD
jgi:KTSC domain